MVLAFKLVSAPILILCLTLLGRRYGPVVGGLLMGIPLVTGPISVFAAIDHGSAFARQAATASLVGQISTCLFCFCYAVSARRLGRWPSAAIGTAGFGLATWAWNRVDWTLLSALSALLATIALLASALKPADVDAVSGIEPRLDLPLRMVVASLFVLLTTLASGRLGPRLSGLLAPFPTFIMIFSVSTHRRMGAGAALNLARSAIVGSLSFAAFFGVAAALLPELGLGAYGPAALASLAASGAIYLALHRPRRV